MKPEHQRIKIAEACGVTNCRMCGVMHLDYTSGVDYQCCYVPDYLNDLNAMHEVEKILDRSQQNAYINILDGMPDDACPVHHDFQWCCATASQRAKAFLQTLGLWEEKP